MLLSCVSAAYAVNDFNGLLYSNDFFILPIIPVWVYNAFV